jgi:hypothetical protein
MAIHNTVTARYSAEATTWFCPHQIGQHSGRAGTAGRRNRRQPSNLELPPTVSWAADRESESFPLSSGNLVAGLGSSQRTVWALAIAARTFGTYSKNAATRWGSGRCHDRRDCGKIQNSPAIRGVDQGPTPAPSSRGGDHLGRSSLALVIAPSTENRLLSSRGRFLGGVHVVPSGDLGNAPSPPEKPGPKAKQLTIKKAGNSR